MSARRRTAGLAAGLAMVALASNGCGNGLRTDPLQDAEQRWSEAGLETYSFTLTSECGERALIGTFDIRVEAGAIVDVEAVTDSGTWVVDEQPELIPTIEDLFALLHDAADADEVTVDYDADLGYPTSIDIDWVRAGIDDEECYTVTDLS